MAEVHYDDTIELLNKCPARGTISKSEDPCTHCEYRNLSDCKTALMRASAVHMQFLQDAVNEYSKYDSFLYVHGFFRNEDQRDKVQMPEYVTTTSSTIYLDVK